MKNWKTSLAGVLSAAFLVFGAHLADTSKPWIDSSNVLPALALAGLGVSSKDSDVTGGSRPQSGS